MRKVLAALAVVVVPCLVSGLIHWHKYNVHEGEESWAIQGLYSQLDCSNQPGHRPYYVEVDGVEFFLECR